MKLHNQALKYLSVSIFIIVSIWAAIFYINLLDEIHDSIDDSLERDKAVILKKLQEDPDFEQTLRAGIQAAFTESNFLIREISGESARAARDLYTDTVMYLLGEDDGEPFRMLTTAFTRGGKFYQLKVISSTVEEDDLIEDLFWAVFWLYIVLLISVAVINNFILKKLWKPFYSLLQQLKNFRIDRNDPLPDIQTNTREFLELKAASDALISHTLDVFSSQKQFTENAAHELQTPLAVMTGKLELTLERGKLDETDAETISQTLQMVNRLSKLNKALLLLSKIENRQFTDDQPIDLNALVKQTAADLEEFSSFKQVKVSVEDFASVGIKMDHTLAHMLVSNLLKNAIIHNVPGGSVHVILEEQLLTVRNTAAGDALPADQIFKRFYKDAPSAQSTGLGLSIVQAICKRYGFIVRYAFEKKEHHFSVRFN